MYGVLIGLEIEGVCEVGAAYFPAIDEMVCAATGEGCYRNGRRTNVSTTRAWRKAWFLSPTHTASRSTVARKPGQRIRSSAGGTRGWSDAYGHALVATGSVELMLDPIMNPWDCGPFPPHPSRSRRYFGDWSGNETIYSGEAISTTKSLLPEVLSLLETANAALGFLWNRFPLEERSVWRAGFPLREKDGVRDR